ncbi:phosphonate C-P lyase system protein PhnG [Desulfolithobacter sp.]
MQIKREDLNDLLQEVAREDVQHLADHISRNTVIHILQHPTQHTLLVPVFDPVSQSRFYSGEALVTSAVVQVNGCNGWSMVMDDQPELALACAIIDGAWGAVIFREDIARLIQQGIRTRTLARKRQQNEVAATEVNFDLL